MAVLTHYLSSHLSLLLLTPLSLSSTRHHAPPLFLRLTTASKPPLSLLPTHSLSTSHLSPEPLITDSGENLNVKLPDSPSYKDEVGNSSGNNNNNNNNVKRDTGWVKVPRLSVKEKKEIGSYAHSLGKKLKSQQVGKGGVTEAVAFALIESLEKNELLKIKIHNNCPGEIDDNVKRLEELTGSVVVGQIGRTVILYRPSMTKLKAEEKKRHAQAVVSRRRQAFKSSSENRGLLLKENGRGRRGSSRYSTPS